MFTIIGADQKEYGPVSVEDVRDWIKQGRADGRTLARKGEGEWKPLSAHEEFSGYTAATGIPPRMPNPPTNPAYNNSPDETILAADPDIDIGDCLHRSWRLLTTNFGVLIGGCTLIWLLDLVAQFIPLVGIFISGALYGGLYLLFLKRIRNEPVPVGVALSGFTAPFVQLLLAGFLISFLCMLGYILCILPALYLKIAWAFALALVIDKRLEFWTAMELSRRVVTRVWFKVFALTVIVFAPFVIIQGVVYAKIWMMMYAQMASLMTNGMPNMGKWTALMTEVGTKIQFLQLAAQIVLLANLPFAIGALMYAYEALFGSRPANAN